MSSKLSDQKIRVRMAPSPTGEYHIGHIRTVLYNYAFAKKLGGKFIIRIEDTDRTRYVEGAVERILQVIKDYNLGWDEGPDKEGPFGPYTQSERLPIYKQYSEDLVKKGNAYYCFCTEERLTAMREEQKTRGVASTKYDRHCLHLSEEEIQKNLDNKVPHVIRLQIPDDRVITFTDIVFGKISVHSKELDDQILIKSDGFPTYHFAVVVDDHLMEITHVMRGNDWLPSTPKHVLLYEAFGWEMPVHIHLPNLKELGGTKKLSKRFGAVFAREFLDEGYLPEALLNFLMFLGWNPGGEKEIFSLEEFIEAFDIQKIHKTDLVAFDRAKLTWINGQYMRDLPLETITKYLIKYKPAGVSEDKFTSIVKLSRERIKKLSEFESFTRFFYTKPPINKEIATPKNIEHLSAAKETISDLQSFTNESITESLMAVVANNNFKTGEFFMDLRVAVAGSKISPPINESMVILGKEESLSRIESFLAEK
jgi:glutamyl-tRNA synthetase